MVKRGASLAGRGGEILLGGQPEETSQPEPAPNEASLPEATDLSEGEPADAGEEIIADELAAALEDEALAATAEIEPGEELGTMDETPAEEEAVPVVGGPSDGGEGELPPLATTPALPAEEGTARAETSAQPTVAVMTSTPEVEHETPPAPMYTQPVTPATEPTVPLPPPKEKPEATDPIVRAKLSGMLYETATEEPPEGRVLPEGPETPELVLEELDEYEEGQPSRLRGERQVLAYVGLRQRQALWDEINELYRMVPDALSTDELQPRALRLLQQAQDILMESPRQFDVAKFKVNQVRSIITRRSNTIRWTNTYGWGVFAYEVLWITVLLLGVFFASRVVTWITSANLEGTEGSAAVLGLWMTMMWGGLGGVIGSFYSLYWHAAMAKDFDKQYLMWYIVQPVIGLLLGGLVHLLIGSGFIAARGEAASGAEVAVSFFPYVVACIASFRQRFILEMIDRVIQVITPSSASPQASVEEALVEEEPVSSA